MHGIDRMITLQELNTSLLTSPITIKIELIRRVLDDHVGDWLVRSIDFSDGYISNNIRFASEKPLSDAICASVSGFISNYLPNKTSRETISSRSALYSDEYVTLEGVHSSGFDTFNFVQKCVIKIYKSFGKISHIIKRSEIYKHFELIGEFLPAKIVQEVVIPLFYLSRIPKSTDIESNDEISIKETLSKVQIENDKIIDYISYYDRYLGGGEQLSETFHHEYQRITDKDAS